MFEEPYRWVEAVANRREYLEEQLKTGSPVVALPCLEGILILSVSAGTQKIYEIYDRVALGALGHPADVERLRNVILDMAHLEGFNRSPEDVTARRLIQFGLAPMVKQAFEEIGHAPFIIRFLIAEIDALNKRIFYTLNYDGVFKEESRGALLSPPGEATERMETALSSIGDSTTRPMTELFPAALRLWALGETTEDQIEDYLKRALKERSLEAVLLSASFPGTAKYRLLTKDELSELTKKWITP